MGDLEIPNGGPGAGSPSSKIIAWRPRRIQAAIVLLAVSFAIFALPPLSARAADQTYGARLRNVDLLTHLTLVLHKSRNLRLDVPFAVVEVADPDIADAHEVSDQQLIILGKKIGATNILLYDTKRKLIGVVDVDVKLDTGSLGAKIREGSGGEGIQVNDVYGKLVLSGNGGDSQTVERAMSVAAGLGPAGVVNAMKVATPQQVMLKVRFVEADRTAARNLGIRWAFFKQNGNMAGVIGTQQSTNLFASPLFPASTSTGGVTTTTTAAGIATTSTTPLSVFDVVGGVGGTGSPFATIITQIVNSKFGSLDAVLSALEAQNVLRELAEPNLIAMSGETADFLAGGEYPVPVVSAASAGTLPTVTIEYKKFGVQLSFMPTVLARGVISLKLMPEVSALDYAHAVMISGTVVPALTSRRARTTVELRDGQTFAIAGLLQADTTSDVEQLPWVGSIPVLGALFRSTQFQRNETELVVLVTPYLVKPVPPGKQLKTPLDTSLSGNDLDLFLNGQSEVPKTPPFTPNPFSGLQSLFGGIEPGPPVPAPVPMVAAPVPVPVAAPVPVPVAAPVPVPVAAPVPVPVAAPVPVPVPVPVPAPVPQGDGASHYDPTTGYFVDPPAAGGGQ